MKKVIAMLMCLVMVLSMAACGTQPAASTEPANSEPPAATAPAETTAPAEATAPVETTAPAQELNNEVVEYYLGKANEVVVTDTHVTFTDDGTGKELSIEKNPKKVAVLFGSLACLWYEAGGTVQLAVGGKSATTTYKEQIGHDITEDEGVKVVTESSNGDGWDVEAILAEAPDLIVASTGMKGYSTISGPATAAGIPVIGINYDGVQDYLKWFKVFCNLNGKPELWDDIAEATAEDIIDIVSKAPEMETPPTVVVLVISSDELKAYTYNSQPGVMLSELGAVNLIDPDKKGGSSSVAVSMEDLYALDPDMIFLSQFGNVTMDTLNEMVGEDPVWQSLRAIKEGKLYSLEKSLFHNKANKNYNEAYRKMAGLLYPDVEF